MTITLSIGSSRHRSRDGEQVVQPGMRDQHDVGLGRRVQRGQQPAGARREHVGHPLGAPGHPLEPAPAQALDAAAPALGGEVAALGEDHERVVLVQVAGEVGDLRLEVLAPAAGWS